jgi:hypothetical protein
MLVRQTLTGPAYPVLMIVPDNQDSVFAVIYANNLISIISANKMSPKFFFRSTVDIICAKWDDNGRLLAIGFRDGTVQIIDFEWLF